MAWTGGPAQSECFAHQGRQELLVHLEQGVHRRLFSFGAGRVAARRQNHPRFVPCARAGPEQIARRKRAVGRNTCQ